MVRRKHCPKCKVLQPENDGQYFWLERSKKWVWICEDCSKRILASS
jgi:hypothetical protein